MSEVELGDKFWSKSAASYHVALTIALAVQAYTPTYKSAELQRQVVHLSPSTTVHEIKLERRGIRHEHDDISCSVCVHNAVDCHQWRAGFKL
ncbi:hypothetical protein LSAT2_026449 [Lamellibrachia satsuma]|nr:hypothetical protein LSAT2_026449 [Lamellibrachia satsuma]